MNEAIYVGRVKKVYLKPEKNYRHATVEPLIRSSEDHKHWKGPILDAVSEFPTRGFLYWHDAPADLVDGEIRQFEAEQHPFYKGEPEKEAYQVKNPKPITEIIDLRGIGSERDIRALLTTSGVSLQSKPLADRCILWILDAKWVGPVKLVRGTGPDSWAISSEQDLDSITAWNIPIEAVQPVELDGTRYLLEPKRHYIGKQIGVVNWQRDNILARRVLEHLRRFDKNAVEALNISKSVFKAYIETIERAGLVGSPQEIAFFERLREIIDSIEKNEELLTEAANICYELSPVKIKVEKKAEEEYQKKLLEHDKHLEQDLATKKAQVDEVVEILSERQNELSSLGERIQSLGEKLKDEVAQFDTELERKLHELAEKPERLFAEMAVLNTIFSYPRRDREKHYLKVQRIRNDTKSDVPIITETKDLKKALFTRLLGARISPAIGQAILTSHLAGLVPVLMGPEAYDVASSYSDCMSGGMIGWIPVGGSMFEPTDLLAKFDTRSCRVIPHSGGLLDLLMDDSDDIHIVLLDGFNRAAVSGYLIPLLQSARDVALGRKPRSIPLIPQGLADKEDGYAGVSRVKWNSKVLLLLCPSSGVSTLPIPAEFWAYCTAIEAAETATVSPSEGASTGVTSRVRAPVWKSWFDNAKHESETVKAESKLSIDAGHVPPIIFENIESLCGSGKMLGLSPERALEQAVRANLLPYLVAANQEEVLSKYSGKEAQKLIDAIRQLGE